MIAVAIAIEMSDMMKESREYDAGKYITLLRNLPEIPGD